MKSVILAGRMKNGKDTVAEQLAREHGYVVVGFADELKRTTAWLFHMDDKAFWGSSNERNRPFEAPIDEERDDDEQVKVDEAMLAELAPREPEVHGLVALMEIQASRLPARVGPGGEPKLVDAVRVAIGSKTEAVRAAAHEIPHGARLDVLALDLVETLAAQAQHLPRIDTLASGGLGAGVRRRLVDRVGERRRAALGGAAAAGVGRIAGRGHHASTTPAPEGVRP